MTSTVVWGFCGRQGRAIVDALAGSLQVTDWFSDEAGAVPIDRFLLGQVPLCKRSPEAVRLFGGFYQDHFRTYSNMVQRRGLQFANLHELTDEFALNFHYFHDLLVRRKTVLVLFASLPHEGSDYVLYQLARVFGLRTLMCYQSLFPNQFCMATTMEDFGRFENIPAIFEHPGAVVEQGYEQPLFYMQSVRRQQVTELGGWADKAIVRTGERARSAARIGKRGLGLLAHPRRVDLSNRAREFIALKLDRKYRANLRKHVVDRARLRELLASPNRLVYFPLHLQPELSTSAIGGVFQDQLYALEVLRDLLDSDWTILVKENPKQGHYQRDESFFVRLSNIENTLLVDGLFPSVEILQRAELTATISGTAGWEAIKGGGKCLAFGQAWYATLVNCLAYHPLVTRTQLNAFLLERKTSDDFMRSCEDLWRKMGSGVIDPVYAEMVDGFDEGENSATVAKSLISVLRHPKANW